MRNIQENRIIIFRALQLGDMLCSIPAIQAIKQANKRIKITLVGLPWAKEFAKRFSHFIDDFIAFPGYPGLPEQPITTLPQNFFKKIKKQGFDLAIQMHGDGTITNTIVEKFSAKKTAGFYNPSQTAKPTNSFITYPENEHEIKKMTLLVNHLGIPAKNYRYSFPIFPEEQKKAQKILHDFSLSHFVCIHPGARDKKRRWNTKHFADLADILCFLGLRVVFTGSSEEKNIMQEIKKKMKYTCVDLSGKTSLGTLAAILKRAKLVICNDTGISHIAAGINKKSIVLFTKYSNPLQWAPLDNTMHVALSHEKATLYTTISTAISLLEKPDLLWQRSII